MFVELENTVEGLIRLANMREDYYIYNQETYTIMGERSHKTFKIGDTVRIKVDNVNVDKTLYNLNFIYYNIGIKM